METDLRKNGFLDTGKANRFQSDRVLNPNALVCPIPQTTDSMGRESHVDTRWSETAGCSSATNRIRVENQQRFQNSGFALSTFGIQGVGNEDCGPRVQRNLKTSLADDLVFRNTQQRIDQWHQMNARIRYYKRLSGCD